MDDRSRNSRRKASAKQWTNIILTTAGIGIGLSGFIAGFHFKNTHTGAWGLVAGTFAGIALHLAILQKTGYLESWYTPKMLCNIVKLGVIGSVAGIAGAVTYLTLSIIDHKKSSLPSTFYVTAATSILTFVFSLYLSILAWRLKVKMEREYASLLGGVRAYPDED